MQDGKKRQVRGPGFVLLLPVLGGEPVLEECQPLAVQRQTQLAVLLDQKALGPAERHLHVVLSRHW
jgi:hypothetical protein